MKYIPPSDMSMDGTNFHALFTIERQGRYYAKFSQQVPFVNMGSTAQMLYYQSRDTLSHFLTNKVLPACEPELLASLVGRPIDVCLHDMVGQDEVDYTVLGFSKKKDDTDNILVPDLYAMNNYFGALDEPDPFRWDQKLDEFFFIGNYTGDGRPLHNKRAQLCRWALDKPWCHAYLSEIHQVPVQTMFEADPEYERYMHPPIPKKYQKIYKHLISVDGNTAAWDRPVWIMNSNSVLWKQESDHEVWWSSLARPWEHYVPFTQPDELRERRQGEFGLIVESAHKLVGDHLTEAGHVERWKNVLQIVDGDGYY